MISVLLLGKAMLDFVPWRTKRSSNGPMAWATQELAHADRWPVGGNNIEHQNVVTVTTNGGQRDDLLTALGRRERTGLLNKLTAYMGVGTLFIAGIIIADSLIYGIFFDLIAYPQHARGLIKFSCSFATIGIIVGVMIAVFWIEHRRSMRVLPTRVTLGTATKAAVGEAIRSQVESATTKVTIFPRSAIEPADRPRGGNRR
jgi:hypothetical protein